MIERMEFALDYIPSKKTAKTRRGGLLSHKLNIPGYILPGDVRSLDNKIDTADYKK
jgi:hypothetical protein